MEKVVEWRIIQEFPNYEVSNTGLVRNIKTQRILKQSDHKQSTLQVKLSMKDSKPVNRSVSRLVAFHFLENPNNLRNVRHKSNWYDNSVENLYFA